MMHDVVAQATPVRPGASGSVVAYLAILALALTLRLLWLDRLPLWSDESFSVLWSRFDLRFLVGAGTGIETNPPLHFVLLKGWIALFGDSAVSVRLPSVLASSAAVVTGYAIGRQLLGGRAALVGGVLLALAPLSVAFAQEARPYAVLELTAAVALLAATRFLLLCTAPAPTAPLRSALGWAVLFAVASATSFQFHYTSLFLVVACLGVVGLRLLIVRPLPVPALLIWFGAGCATAALIALPLLAAMSMAHSANLDWIGKPTPVGVLGFLTSVLIGEGTFRAKTTVVLEVLAVAGWGLARRYRATSPTLWLLVAVPAIAAAALIVVSLTRSLIIPRYAEWLLTPVLLAVAAGLDGLSKSWSKVLIPLVLVGCAAALGLQFRMHEKEDWHTLSAILQRNRACRGPIAFDGGSLPIGLSFYDRSLLRRPLWRVNREPPLPTAEHYLFSHLAKEQDLPAALLRPFLQQQPGAVFIARGAGLGSDSLELFERQIGPHRYEQDLHGGLHLWCE